MNEDYTNFIRMVFRKLFSDIAITALKINTINDARGNVGGGDTCSLATIIIDLVIICDHREPGELSCLFSLFP